MMPDKKRGAPGQGSGLTITTVNLTQTAHSVNLTREEADRLDQLADALFRQGLTLERAGNFLEAQRLFIASLEITRRLNRLYLGVLR